MITTTLTPAVAVGLLDGAPEAAVHLERHGVLALGPVDGQPSGAVANLVVEVARAERHQPRPTHTFFVRQKLSDALDPALAAVAALLHAAERRRRATTGRAVDRHEAGLERGRQAVGARQVARLDVGGEAVLGVVGESDGLVLVVERRHRQHRSEDLLLRQRAGVVDVGEEGRGDEVAVGEVAAQPRRRRRRVGRLRTRGLVDHAEDPLAVARLMTGPMPVPGSSGSPTRTRSAARDARSTTAS